MSSTPLLCAVPVLLALAACRSTLPEPARPSGSIRIADKPFALWSPVVPWSPEADGPPRIPGRVHPHFEGVEVPADCDDPARVAQVVDRIVLTHEGGDSAPAALRALFAEGHGVHFAIDLDGTIYQALDVRDSVQHRGRTDSRDIAILLAGPGAVRPREAAALDAWYRRDGAGLRMDPPADRQVGAVREAASDLRPRGGRVRGEINGYVLEQVDYNVQQYDSLVQLAATLCRALPRLRPDAPRDGNGFLLHAALDAQHLRRFRGIVGSYHTDPRATGPGPAFDWEGFLRELRAELDAWPK